MIELTVVIKKDTLSFRKRFIKKHKNDLQKITFNSNYFEYFYMSIHDTTFVRLNSDYCFECVETPKTIRELIKKEGENLV